jgi:hypothetical protein
MRATSPATKGRKIVAKDKTIIRTRKNRENPYVMVDKYGINDERLSLKAKGLLVTLLSRPDDWQFYMSELAKTCKDGIDSVRSALNELRKYGYVSMERVRNEKGQLKHTEYVVYERPFEEQEEAKTLQPQGIQPKRENPILDEQPKLDFPVLDNPNLDKPNLDKPDLENPILLNNDLKLNNDLTNKTMVGWMGDESQDQSKNEKESTSKKENITAEQAKQEWQLVKGRCERYGLDREAAREFMKVWKYYYPDAPVAMVCATISEMMEDRVNLQTGDRMEYSNMPGLFHHRMKVWKSMKAVFDEE